MWKPPASNRVVDFSPDGITTIEDMDRALVWLKERRSDLEGQIEFRDAMKTANPEWKAKINLVLKHTRVHIHAINTRREDAMRALKLDRQSNIEREFMNSVLSIFDPKDVDEVWRDLWRRRPELKK